MSLSVILPHLGSSSTSPVSTFICSPAQQILRLVPARNSRRTRCTQPGLPRGHETIKESHPTFSSTVRASEDPGATPLAVAAPWAFARCRSRVGVGWPWGLLRGQGPATCQAEPQVREFWRWSGHRPGNPPGLCSQLPPWGGAGGFPSAGRGSGRAGPSRPEPRARSRRPWAPGSRQEVFRRSGRDFHYVAVDFGGHGLSSHYGPGLPYYQQNFVSEVRRVAAGGLVGGMFSCVFPEMVDKLILLEATPFAVDSNEMENLLTYKRRAIEHTLLVEASKKPSSVVSWEEMLWRFLQNNSHVSEESGELLLQRGTTPVAGGLVLNRDRRMSWPEHSSDYISKELFVHSIKKLRARVLLVKASHGYYNVRRENADREHLHFVLGMLKSVLKEVGVRGSGDRGPGQGRRPLWAPSHPLFCLDWDSWSGLAPALTGDQVLPGLTPQRPGVTCSQQRNRTPHWLTLGFTVLTYAPGQAQLGERWSHAFLGSQTGADDQSLPWVLAAARGKPPRGRADTCAVTLDLAKVPGSTWHLNIIRH
ncbi:serine hydrolase-like protein 2 isoform X4 [Equus asinus]|uniref:serine hydrolase-like protein 2 isoform X4 n=1 Tax=Equus asinus TaxID=9793 RepID=UPI0038F72082